jgi:branched-chain amino acid transport system permease protein
LEFVTPKEIAELFNIHMVAQLIINIILSSFEFLLIALSFIIIYYPSKFFHFAHGGIISLGAYFTYFVFHQLVFPIWVAIIVSVILSALVGILARVLIYKPISKRNVSALILLIVSLGLYVIIQNCISMIWGDETKNIRTSEVKMGNEFFGAYVTNIQVISILISFSIFIIYLLFSKYNKIGRNIRAVAANPELANIVGIDSDRIILWSFGLGSGMAAIAGILVASDTGLTPTMGFNLLLYGVIAMIIGGVGSNWGLIGGALLLATAQHLSAFYIDSKWMDAITYLIMILFLIWKPLGFSGNRLKKIEV